MADIMRFQTYHKLQVVSKFTFTCPFVFIIPSVTFTLIESHRKFRRKLRQDATCGHSGYRHKHPQSFSLPSFPSPSLHPYLCSHIALHPASRTLYNLCWCLILRIYIISERFLPKIEACISYSHISLSLHIVIFILSLPPLDTPAANVADLTWLCH